jgi:hypothetical protein
MPPGSGDAFRVVVPVMNGLAVLALSAGFPSLTIHGFIGLPFEH